MKIGRKRGEKKEIGKEKIVKKLIKLGKLRKKGIESWRKNEMVIVWIEKKEREDCNIIEGLKEGESFKEKIGKINCKGIEGIGKRKKEGRRSV